MAMSGFEWSMGTRRRGDTNRPVSSVGIGNAGFGTVGLVVIIGLSVIGSGARVLLA